MPSRAPSPLLAVLLTAESSRGSTLVFRWPPAPSLFKRHSRVRYYSATASDKDGSRSPPPGGEALHRGSYVRGRAEGAAAGRAPWEELQERATRDEEGGSASDTSESSAGDESGLSDFNDVDFDVGSSAASASGADEALSDHFSETNPLPRTRARLGSSSILSGPASGGGAGARSRSRPPAPLRDARSSPSPDRERERERNAGRAKRAAKSYGRYLGYDEAFLATLLSPRPEACHAKFELVVDDLAFVGHPVCVDAEGKWSAPPEQPSSAGAAAAGPSRPRGRSGGTSTNADADAQHSEERDSSANTGESRGITAFHLVLVLDRPDPSAALPQLDISAWCALYHDAVAFKLTAALWAEEVRCSYVGRESDRLTSLREACRDRGDSYTTYLSSALRSSSLARLLRSLHSSLARSANAFVSVNDSIDAHLQLPPLLHDGARLGRLREVETSLDANDPLLAPGAGGRWAGTGDAWAEASRATGPLLLPWKTLLVMGAPRHGKDADDDEDADSQLSASEEELKDGIEAWAKRFTSYLKPTLSGIPTFAELATLLQWDLHADVYPMVRHLIYYREARVVDVPRIHSTYALSPLFDLRDLAPLSHSWHRSFPTQPSLPAFLAALTASLRPFAALFSKTQRQAALDSLVWLLRHDVVVQMHVRLRLVATEEVKRAAARKRAAERDRKRQRRKRIEERRMKREARAKRKAEKAAAAAATSPPAGPRPRASQVAAVIAEQREVPRGRSREREGIPTPKAAAFPTSALSKPAPSASGSARTPSLSPTTAFTRLSTDARRDASSNTELRFERRRVLRSRSPSTLFSSSGAAHSALSASVKAAQPAPMTGLGSGSRPSTPRGRALSVREAGFASDSSAQGSVVGTGTGTGAGVGRRPSRTGGTSRSPSRARLRVTGFGDGEEVHLADEDDNAGVAGSLLAQQLRLGTTHPSDSTTGSGSASGSQGASLGRSASSTTTRSRGASTLLVELGDEARRLSLVGEVSEDIAAARADAGTTEQRGLDETVVLTPPAVHEASDSSREEEDDDADGEYDEDEDDGAGVSSELDEWEWEPTPSIIAEPSRASGEENEWITAMAEGHEEWLVNRLFSLLPYLNGRHTIDEIVYREEMRRKELRALLNAFSADIITVVHP